MYKLLLPGIWMIAIHPVISPNWFKGLGYLNSIFIYNGEEHHICLLVRHNRKVRSNRFANVHQMVDKIAFFAISHKANGVNFPAVIGNRNSFAPFTNDEHNATSVRRIHVYQGNGLCVLVHFLNVGLVIHTYHFLYIYSSTQNWFLSTINSKCMFMQVVYTNLAKYAIFLYTETPTFCKFSVYDLHIYPFVHGWWTFKVFSRDFLILLPFYCPSTVDTYRYSFNEITFSYI